MPAPGFFRGFFSRPGIRFLSALLREKRCCFCSAPILPGTEALITKRQAPVDCHKLGVCPDCLARLPRRSAGYCLRCGEFMGLADLSGAICPHCLRQPPPWQAVYFYGAYQGYLRDLVLRVKFSEGLHQAEGLGRLLALHPALQRLPAGQPSWHPGQELLLTGCHHSEYDAAQKADALPAYSCIVPVPLHKKRLRERGFNQAALLASPLAAQLRLRLARGLLYRTVDTPHQTGLTRERRRRNLSGAFQASPKVRGLRILLFDDVMTTGATLSTAAACLLRAGAERVDVAVIARTPARNMTSQAF